jgi:TolB protein
MRKHHEFVLVAVLALAACGKDATGPTRKPALIAFGSDRQGGQHDIFTMDLAGGQVVNLTNNAAGDYAPAWSPDGQQIAFWSGRDANYEIYVMNADGSSPVRLTNNAALDQNPRWRP